MFERLELLIGEKALEKLQKTTILVIGLGGVGGYVVESLVRSGIGKLILVDYDTIDITNMNRQIIALHSTIGMKKVDAWEQRIHDINPHCKVIKIDNLINPENIEILFSEKLDYLVDACDTVSTKKEIIRKCIDKKIPFISSMGTGKKMDPTRLKIVDIRKTSYDPIAKIIRKMVKEERIKEKIMVICSEEAPIESNSKMIASNAFVPSTAGLLCTSYIIDNLVRGVK